MIMSGLARLGRDAELRYTPGSDAVASLSLVFSHGKKQQDGSRESQWVEAALWGKQAEALAKYLLKGTLINSVIDAPHIQTFQKNDGTTGTKLVGRIVSIEFAGSNKNAQQDQQQAKPVPNKQAEEGYDNFEDIPF